MIRTCRGYTLLMGLVLSNVLSSQTIPSITITNFQSDIAYLINWDNQRQVALTYKDACLAFSDLYWGLIPSQSVEEACYTPSQNTLLTGAQTWYCADGTLAYDNTPWWSCNPIYTCPNKKWKLSPDKETCMRDAPSCTKTPDDVSEFQFISAIVYGEASLHSTYEEKAAIANAIINKRNALGYSTVQNMAKALPKWAKAFYKRKERYVIAMCANLPVEYPELNNAVQNALDPEGFDYSNGGCFWDGTDLKTAGSRHLHYGWGYKITDPAHNVLGVSQPSPKHQYEKSTKKYWDYTLDSTAGYGKTIFFKYNSDYISARRAKPCL